MDKRILVGCIAALGTILGFDLLAQASGGTFDVPMRTPLGAILAGHLAVTFAAMILGGWIARHRFRWIAVALSATVWAATLAVLMAITPATGVGATMSLPTIVEANALAIALSLLLSWLGAALGERLSARHRLRASP